VAVSNRRALRRLSGLNIEFEIIVKVYNGFGGQSARESLVTSVIDSLVQAVVNGSVGDEIVNAANER